MPVTRYRSDHAGETDDSRARMGSTTGRWVNGWRQDRPLQVRNHFIADQLEALTDTVVREAGPSVNGG